MGNRGIIERFRGKQFGFQMKEVMSGEHEFEPGLGPPGRRPMEFRVTWGPACIKEWLTPSSDRFLWQELEGEVSIDGLCDRAPCKGTLELRYFDQHRLRYAFDFEAGGRPYHFVGEKVNLQLWNLPVSHTTCYGRVTERETGKLVSTSVTHFRMKTVPAFLASIRVTTSPEPETR